MKFVFRDVGRAGVGYEGYADDCVTHSIATATDKPYREIDDQPNALVRSERKKPNAKRARSSSRTGVERQIYERYLRSLGWTWVSTMSIGSGCKVHVHDSELPSGRLLVRYLDTLLRLSTMSFMTHTIDRGAALGVLTDTSLHQHIQPKLRLG